MRETLPEKIYLFLENLRTGLSIALLILEMIMSFTRKIFQLEHILTLIPKCAHKFVFDSGKYLKRGNCEHHTLGGKFFHFPYYLDGKNITVKHVEVFNNPVENITIQACVSYQTREIFEYDSNLHLKRAQYYSSRAICRQL